MSNDLIQLDYRLTFTTPFHFGTGLREGLIDRSVRRDPHGYLYVPGSTLKGVIREHCEQLARLLDPVNTRIVSPHDEKSALTNLCEPTTKTLITHIFGSHNHPGLLFFDDAHQTEENLKSYDGRDLPLEKGKYKPRQTEMYTQVRLDRQTRTAVPGALFTSEFGQRDFSFVGSISGWLNHTPIPGLDDASHELLLLLAGFLMVDRLGGNKSTGKGECTKEITRLHLNKDKDNIEKKTWSTWLDHLDQLKESMEEPQ